MIVARNGITCKTPLKMIFGGTTHNDEGDLGACDRHRRDAQRVCHAVGEKLAERGVLTTEWLDSGSVETDIWVARWT